MFLDNFMYLIYIDYQLVLFKKISDKIFKLLKKNY